METLKLIFTKFITGILHTFATACLLMYAAGIVATIWMIIYFIKIIIYLFTL